MKRILLTLSLFLSVPVWSAVLPDLPAHPAAMTDHQLDAPCLGDIEKFCKGIEPGEGRIVKCLKENQQCLSPACKKASEAKKEEIKAKYEKKRTEVREACGDDFKKFCQGTKGPMKRLNCLKRHDDQLSAACKASISQKAQ